MEISQLEHDIKKLEKQKIAWYNEAVINGTIGKLWKIAKTLGHDPASIDADGNPTYMRSTYGPKYVWQCNGVRIFADNYGNYLTVHWDDREVCSTHTCSQLFVPGDWLQIVLPFVEEADREKMERERSRLQGERQKLMEELGLI